MSLTGIAAIGKLAFSAIDRFIPDPQKKIEAQLEIQNKLIDNGHKVIELASKNIETEAASKHWLAANWRPITMLTFVGLIVARWLGFAAPDLSEAEYLKLWDIVQLGLGGYVFGRTAEKIAPGIVNVFKK
jgi:hypothetical protein